MLYFLFFMILSSLFCKNFSFAAAEKNVDGPLHHIVRKNDKDAFWNNSLQWKQEGIDRRGNEQRTPLFLAVYLGKVEMVKKLLISGANIHVCDASGRSVFHEALMGLCSKAPIFDGSEDFDESYAEIRKTSMTIINMLLKRDPALANMWNKNTQGYARFFGIPRCYALFLGNLELFLALEPAFLRYGGEEVLYIIPQEYSLKIVDLEKAFDLSETIIPITVETYTTVFDQCKRFTAMVQDKEKFGFYIRGVITNGPLKIFMLRLQEAFDAWQVEMGSKSNIQTEKEEV